MTDDTSKNLYQSEYTSPDWPVSAPKHQIELHCTLLQVDGICTHCSNELKPNLLGFFKMAINDGQMGFLCASCDEINWYVIDTSATPDATGGDE